MRLINTLIVVAATIGLLVLWGNFLAYYGRLPEIIPTHFGFSGAADGWGGKPLLLLFPLLGLVAYAVALSLHYLILPGRAQLPPVLHTLLFLIMAELVWFWFFLQLETIRVALGYTAGLDSGFNIPVGIIVLTALALIAAKIATRNWNST